MPRDGDRPKRSWREIDKKKDSSAHRQADRAPLDKNRQARADSASKVYKSKLDAFFDGETKAPAMVQDQLEKLKPTSPEEKARAKALQAIKDVGTSSAADKAVGAYLETWKLPPDFDVLSQVLTCSDEDYLSDAMALLDKMLGAKRVPKRTPLLEQRLRRVKTLADDPDLQEEAGELLLKLRLFS
jgi:hypothetical protein